MNSKVQSLILGLAFTSAISGCSSNSNDSSAKQPPAKVATIAHEEQLNTIQLSPEAERRLGITTVPAQMQMMSRTRAYGGEIVLPPGASIIISAPLSGTLAKPSPEGVPTAGSLVAEKQTIFWLTPLLSPERDVLTPAERLRLAEAKNAIATMRVDADSQVQQAAIQVEAARIALERAERLLRDSAGTARAVDEARAQMMLAQKALEAAESRKKLVDSISLEEETGKPVPLRIESPHAGMVRSHSALAGEVVAAAAPLFEIMRFDPMWIKVPVYVGDVSKLAIDQDAQVSSLQRDPSATTAVISAKPIAAPPTATPLSATVDLYYELSNPEAILRPGQRMAVRLKQLDRDRQLVVPWSAVLHDIHGGTWVYENTAPQTYVRRRVQVRYVADSNAVLESGPAPGSMIVAEGAVELFGTEFGFAK